MSVESNCTCPPTSVDNPTPANPECPGVIRDQKWKRLHDQQQAARDAWIETARSMEIARNEALGLWQAEYERAERLRKRIARIEALADRWDETLHPVMVGIVTDIRAAIADPRNR